LITQLISHADSHVHNSQITILHSVYQQRGEHQSLKLVWLNTQHYKARTQVACRLPTLYKAYTGMCHHARPSFPCNYNKSTHTKNNKEQNSRRDTCTHWYDVWVQVSQI